MKTSRQEKSEYTQELELRQKRQSFLEKENARLKSIPTSELTPDDIQWLTDVWTELPENEQHIQRLEIELGIVEKCDTIDKSPKNENEVYRLMPAQFMLVIFVVGFILLTFKPIMTIVESVM